MRLRNWCRSFAVVVVVWGCCLTAESFAGVLYQDPTGGWGYVYQGDTVENDSAAALDGSWSHDNGSDVWDGSGIGEADSAPGGASVLTEGNTKFLRVEDTGDPRTQGFTDPSNRKIYFTRDITELDESGDLIDQGVTLSFRTRLATTGLLDQPVTAPGDGYYILDDGKSTFSIHQANGGTISFALSTSSGDDRAENGTGALLMNGFVDGGDGSQVDSTDSGEHRELPVNDTATWNEFWITIKANANDVGQFDVNIYANGSTTPQSFVVTGGNGAEFPSSYIAMGQHSTAQTGAVDIDYYGVKAGILVPVLAGPAGIIGDVDEDGALNVADIDQITAAVRAGSTAKKFDVNNDGAVSSTDRTYWVDSLKKTYLGDANLDGEFNSADFIQVFQAGQYEDAVAGNSTWGTGDFDGDGDFGSGDFVAAFQSGGYEAGPRPAVSAVPEPASALGLAAVLLGLFGRARVGGRSIF